MARQLKLNKRTLTPRTARLFFARNSLEKRPIGYTRVSTYGRHRIAGHSLGDHIAAMRRYWNAVADLL